jgi:Mycotoxin biosynthesis protein UstYa
MLTNYTQLQKPRASTFVIRVKRLAVLAAILCFAIFLSYIVIADLGSVSSWFEDLRQKLPLPVTYSCIESAKDDPSLPFLGPRLRTINAPHALVRDQEVSLLQESNTADKGGFIRLRENDGRVNYYGVSMYHQLHCIKMLRDRIEGNDVGSHTHKRESIDDQVTPDHLIHCLDYIAQVLFPNLNRISYFFGTYQITLGSYLRCR